MSLELLAMWSQIGGALVFVICAVLLWFRFLAPAVQGYQNSKNAELAEGERHREHMRAEVAAAQSEIARAGEDAREIRERIDLVTKRDRERALADAQAEAERIIRNAEGELERARMAARDKLRIELIDKALAAARERAPQRVDDGVNRRLVLRTVDDLARGPR